MKVLFALFTTATASLAGQAQETGLEWLAGCWISPDAATQEVWVTEKLGPGLTGFSVSIRDGAVRFYEVLSIEQTDPAGPLVYTAYPSGQSPTSFTAEALSEHSALFVNADHDYPQEIRYEREGNEIRATISLLGGREARVQTMIACD